MEGNYGSTDNMMEYSRYYWDLEWDMRKTFQNMDIEVYSTGR